MRDANISTTRRMRQSHKRYNGHRATIWPWLTMQARPPVPTRTTVYQTTVEDKQFGQIQLHGHLDDVPGATTLVIAVHGLGGCSDALYCKLLAVKAQARNMACLRISCRGAARKGEDLHHAGLYEDIEHVIRDPLLARFTDIIVVGFSLGGHMSLRLSGACKIDRLKAVLACCPPIDLEEVTRHLDAKHRWIYRQHVLRGLHELYEPLAERDRAPTPQTRMNRVRALREWDAVATVPRFGFDSVAHYYHSQSVIHQVEGFHQPTFILASPNDPMIPGAGLARFAKRKPDNLHLTYVHNGGHAFFSGRNNVPGFSSREHVFGQMLDWIEQTLS